MDELTKDKLSFILHDAQAVVDSLSAMLGEEEPEREPSAAEMVKALVASTGGKRYVWADRFGVDEIQIRRWEDGKTQPNAKHLKLIKEAYRILISK
jgi:DNA-binding transcriptional regulator YiaG